MAQSSFPYRQPVLALLRLGWAVFQLRTVSGETRTRRPKAYVGRTSLAVVFKFQVSPWLVPPAARGQESCDRHYPGTLAALQANLRSSARLMLPASMAQAGCDRNLSLSAGVAV